MKCSTVITRKTERVEMANKRPKPEEIVAKLRRIEVGIANVGIV